MEDEEQAAKTKTKAPAPEQPQSSLLIFQQNIAPGNIKQQHLLPSPSRKGDLYYGKDGVNFDNLKIGSSGSLLEVVSGVPAWLAPGSANKVLTIVGGIPTWQTPSSANTIVVSSSTVVSSFTTTSATYVDDTVAGSSVSIVTTVACNINIIVSITAQNDSATASFFLGIGKGTNTAIWEKSVDAAHTSVGNTSTISYTDPAVAAGTNVYHLGGHTNGGNTLNITAGTIVAIAYPS